ncbi:MAG: ABC transporter ATP-binding protein [Anaerolineae bacterium]
MLKSKIYPTLDLKQTTSANRLLGLWRLMTGFRAIYAGGVAGLAIAAAAKTGTYLLLRQFADTAVNQAADSGGLPIHYFAFGFLGLALFEAAFTFLSGWLAARTAEGVTLRLRNFLFDHMQRLTFSYHDHMQTGELIQRVTSDVDAVRHFFADQGTQVGRITMLFAINLIALLALNVKLALLSVLFVPVIFLVSVAFFKKLAVVYDAYQDQDGVLSGTLQENLSGVRVVKAFARQQFEIEKFEAVNHKKYRLGKKLLLMHAFYWPISDAICGGQMLMSFYLGARMAIAGEITIGTYLAFANLVIWIIWPMRNLGRLIAQSSSGLVSYRRVASLIDEEQETLNRGLSVSDGDIRGELVFDHVTFEYTPQAPVLKDITFTARPGEIIALMGPTGSGKTSLVNLLPRFYDYTAGRLTLDGRDLTDYAPHTLRRHIGIVEQEPFLFSRTIAANIAYGVRREVSQAEIEAAARAAAIHDVITTFPNGYNTLVGERGVTLSGGQKQRIAIARTLLKDPRILILDDSTSSVDTETEGLIQAALNRLMQGRTTFIIAHRIQTVMRADKILVLQEGQIAQQGTHRQLVNRPGLYRDIYDIQAKIDAEVQQEVDGVKLPL